MASMTLQELVDATDRVLGNDGGKHRLDDKARAVVLERNELRAELQELRALAAIAIKWKWYMIDKERDWSASAVETELADAVTDYENGRPKRGDGDE